MWLAQFPVPTAVLNPARTPGLSDRGPGPLLLSAYPVSQKQAVGSRLLGLLPTRNTAFLREITFRKAIQPGELVKAFRFSRAR